MISVTPIDLHIAYPQNRVRSVLNAKTNGHLPNRMLFHRAFLSISFINHLILIGIVNVGKDIPEGSFPMPNPSRVKNQAMSLAFHPASREFKAPILDHDAVHSFDTTLSALANELERRPQPFAEHERETQSAPAVTHRFILFPDSFGSSNNQRPHLPVCAHIQSCKWTADLLDILGVQIVRLGADGAPGSARGNRRFCLPTVE
jgi:hypothetical protein